MAQFERRFSKAPRGRNPTAKGEALEDKIAATPSPEGAKSHSEGRRPGRQNRRNPRGGEIPQPRAKPGELAPKGRNPTAKGDALEGRRATLWKRRSPQPQAPKGRHQSHTYFSFQAMEFASKSFRNSTWNDLLR